MILIVIFIFFFYSFIICLIIINKYLIKLLNFNSPTGGNHLDDYVETTSKKINVFI